MNATTCSRTGAQISQCLYKACHQQPICRLLYVKQYTFHIAPSVYNVLVTVIKCIGTSQTMTEMDEIATHIASDHASRYVDAV